MNHFHITKQDANYTHFTNQNILFKNFDYITLAKNTIEKDLYDKHTDFYNKLFAEYLKWFKSVIYRLRHYGLPIKQRKVPNITDYKYLLDKCEQYYNKNIASTFDEKRR